MPSVYVETTIPSFYYETRADESVKAWRNATRQWWDNHRVAYNLHSSRFVVDELSQSPAAKAARMLAMLEPVPLLAEPAELADVIAFYVEHRLMPADAVGDAAHLALASLHSMDFLLTWNCRHLANANKIRHINVVNGRLGLRTPVITTPLNLMPEE